MKGRKTCKSCCRPGETEFTAAALAALPALLDPDRCREWLFERLRPGRAGEVCPFCRESLSESMKQTFRRLKVAACRQCGKQFSALSGTPLSGTHLDPAEILLVAALAALGIEARQIAPLLGREVSTTAANLRRVAELAESPAPAEDGGLDCLDESSRTRPEPPPESL